MTDAQQMANVALVMSQIVSAYARIEAMKAANLEREHKGEALAYPEQSFEGVVEEFAIGWNSVLSILGGE